MSHEPVTSRSDGQKWKLLRTCFEDTVPAMATPDAVHLLLALSHGNFVGLKSWASDRYSIDNAAIAVGK